MRRTDTHTFGDKKDARSYDDFVDEIRAIRDQPLAVQLAFMRNRKNRDRAMSIPADRLRRILLG